MESVVLDRDMLHSVKEGNHRRGQNQLIKHLTGIRLTQRQAIYAKCYDCSGMGESKVCDIVSCSLYPFSQFGKKA